MPAALPRKQVTVRVLVPRRATQAQAGDRDHGYSLKEIRTAVKLLHRLPADAPIVIDLFWVREWLGLEHRLVFDLLAQQRPLADIGRFWAQLHDLPERDTGQATELGSDVADQLARDLRWLLSLEVRPMTIEVIDHGPTPPAKSQYRGVSRIGNRFIAQIGISGRTRWLGSFASEVEAARAYDRAALEARGPAAKLNFPSESRRAGAAV